jgi:hypothetical protein
MIRQRIKAGLKRAVAQGIASPPLWRVVSLLRHRSDRPKLAD